MSATSHFSGSFIYMSPNLDSSSPPNLRIQPDLASASVDRLLISYIVAKLRLPHLLLLMIDPRFRLSEPVKAALKFASKYLNISIF